VSTVQKRAIGGRETKKKKKGKEVKIKDEKLFRGNSSLKNGTYIR